MKNKLYKNKRDSEVGFSLVEATITSAIVVLVLVGFMKTNISLQRTSESSFERSTALQDANQVLERMRDIAPAGTFPTNVVSAYPNGNTVSGFTALNGETITVNYVNPVSDPLDITILVQWNEHGLRPVTAHLRTYLTQRISQ